MKKLLLALFFLIPALASAQDFRHRYFHYDQIYTDPDNQFKITASTIDGADTKVISLSGGGATLLTGTRGAGIDIAGNEDATIIGRGVLQLYTGDSASSLMTFSTNGNLRLTIPYVADTDDVDLILGKASTTAPIFTIRGQTADGDDDGTLRITAGGAGADSTRGGYLYIAGQDVGGADKGGDIALLSGRGASGADYPWAWVTTNTVDGSDWGRTTISAGSSVSTTRGAYIDVYGNEYSASGGYDGAVTIVAGDDSGGGFINLYTGAGYQQWSIPRQTAATAVSLKFGADAANAVTASIFSARDTDGTDDDVLQLGGGGALSSSRGAYAQFYGNEGAAPYGGDALILSGNGAGDRVILWVNSTSGAVVHRQSGNESSQNMNGVACEEITIPVGSGLDPVVTSATNLCASGIITAVGARVTTAPGGGATTFDVGCTGSGNLDQFCDGVSTAAGTTCAYPTNGDGTNTPWVQKAATTMTITTDADVATSDMKIRVCPYYFDTTAPTS